MRWRWSRQLASPLPYHTIPSVRVQTRRPKDCPALGPIIVIQRGQVRSSGRARCFLPACLSSRLRQKPLASTSVDESSYRCPTNIELLSCCHAAALFRCRRYLSRLDLTQWLGKTIARSRRLSPASTRCLFFLSLIAGITSSQGKQAVAPAQAGPTPRANIDLCSCRIRIAACGSFSVHTTSAGSARPPR